MGKTNRSFRNELDALMQYFLLKLERYLNSLTAMAMVDHGRPLFYKLLW